jgi:4-amino-4-deoxy-L-arabinose transferase-like glycosyltransferase
MPDRPARKRNEEESSVSMPSARATPNFLTWIEQRPGAAFAAFAALHMAVWTALPALLYLNLPLDLIEALTYGREWQLGYDKLPPLPWWLVEVAYRLAGDDIAYYALAQIAVIAAFALVWAMARPLVGGLGALVAVLILDGLHYFSYTAAKFNHDVVQLPFWALAGFAFHRALRTGRLLYWILLGLALGLSLWAKYFIVVLALPLALFMLFDNEARKTLTTPGPYVAAAIALTVAAPHLLWLVNNDFLPFHYAEARAAPSRGLIDHILHPLEFAVDQLGFLLPALLIAAPLWFRRETAAATPRFYDWRIVTLLAFGPMATVLALSALTGRGTVAMWGYPLWLFLGVWIVMTVGAIATARLKWIVGLWAIVFCGLAVAFIGNYAVLPAYDARYRAVLYPGDRLAAEMSQRFRAATGKPLAYVVSEMWTGGNIGHYAPEHPRVLIDGKPERAPWIDLTDLKARGAVVVWTEGDLDALPADYRAIAPGAEVQPPFALPYRKGGLTLQVGWAILRGANSNAR